MRAIPLGRIAACVLVPVAALLLRRPLSRVPENALKFTVGVIISAFGLFWFGEGVGISWPYRDAAILGLAALLLAVSRVAVAYVRHMKSRKQVSSLTERAIP